MKDGSIIKHFPDGQVLKIENSESKKRDSVVMIKFTIGGISFNCKIHRKIMKEQRFLPSDRVYVNIDTNQVCWI